MTNKRIGNTVLRKRESKFSVEKSVNFPTNNLYLCHIIFNMIILSS